jgi:hypothetical protein
MHSGVQCVDAQGHVERVIL